MTPVPAPSQGSDGVGRTLSLRLDEFASDAIEQESARLGMSEEELVRYAVQYFLADVDSGRMARRPPTSEAPHTG
jgi:hypothetical protein